MQILNTKQLQNAIKSLAGKTAALQDSIQQILVAVAYQVAEGNVSHITALLQALPYGVRAERIKAWVLANLPVKLNPDKEARASAPYVRTKWKNPHGTGKEANEAFALALADIHWYDKPAPAASDADAEQGEKSPVTKLVATLNTAKGKLEKMDVSADISEALAALDKAIQAIMRQQSKPATAAKQGEPIVTAMAAAMEKPRKVKSKAKAEPQPEVQPLAKAA